ncbi:MAG: hypothetical protein JSW58_08380 [Candidatus Latescibacterota bacterium]|nr:MAG: hypothetical protein JSW58_08380 [Candidatus Latescibacterota bacterium]
MGIYRLLSRAYAHNKQCLFQDGGQCYDPFGKFTPGAYTGVGIFSGLWKFAPSVYAGGRMCLGVIQAEIPMERPAANDTIYVTGTTNFDGEHTVYGLHNDDPTRVLFIDNKNDANAGSDAIIENAGWMYFAPTSRGDIMVEALRVISHPGFPQKEGEGIYTYPVNPDITRNFMYHPVSKLDGVVQRTLSSNVFIMSPQVDEDIIITEIWLGGQGQISAFAEMARLFHLYWTTMPSAGEVLGWEPRDRTSDRFGVQIVRVQLGGLEFEYKEVRAHVQQHQGAMLENQLTVQWKLAKRVIPPKPMITLTGR